ncbi:MAG TPA: hypothetical protein VG937_25555 [Polyangiaceae bacterium]|nr:hypothetical protein [Polyangiaceae bacterium]
MSGVARAEGAPRVAVYVQGTDAKTVRKEIVKLVPEGVEVDASAFAKSLEERGFVKDPKFDTSKKLADRVAKAMTASKVDLAVVTRVNKNRVAHVLVFRRGASEAEVDETVELGKKSGSDAENAALAAKLGSVFPTPKAVEEKKKPAEAEEESEAEAEAEPEKNTTKAEPAPAADEAAEPEEAPHPSTLPAFAIGLGIGIGARDFDYENRVTPNLRPYSNWGIGVAELDAEGYPLAKDPGALKNLGLTGSFLIALPFKTEVEEGGSAKPKGSYLRYSLGLRYRIPLATRSALFVSAGFIEQTFNFKSAGSLADTIPAVKYRSIEPGLGARIAAGPAVVLVGAGYRFVFSGGKVKSRFPHASLGAIAAHLGAGLPLGKSHWEARLMTRYERYFYTMNASEDDEYVAGGALDQYFTFLGGVAYVF